MGKMLAKVFFYAGEQIFTEYIDKMISIVENRDLELSKLIIKRNVTIYLNKVVGLYGDS